MTGILCLGCLVTGFIVAWLLRTWYVTAQLSWAQEQAERNIRYWQGEALHARAVADHLLRQLEATTARPTGPLDSTEAVAGRRRPDMD